MQDKDAKEIIKTLKRIERSLKVIACALAPKYAKEETEEVDEGG